MLSGPKQMFQAGSLTWGTFMGPWRSFNLMQSTLFEQLLIHFEPLWVRIQAQSRLFKLIIKSSIVKTIEEKPIDKSVV